MIPPHVGDLDLRLTGFEVVLWVELYLYSESQQKWKNGDEKTFRQELDKSERKRFDVRCCLIHDYITPQELWLASLCCYIPILMSIIFSITRSLQIWP
jgi:hypothetical protein